MRDLEWCAAQVQRYKPEASSLRQPIGSFHGMLDIPAAAHPQNLREVNTGIGGARGIEGVL